MAIRALEQKKAVDEVFEKITADLRKHGYPKGTKLQTIRQIAKNYSTSYLTAQKAIKKLQDQGVLKATTGDGIYIANELAPDNSSTGPNGPAHTAQMPQTERKIKLAAKAPGLCVVLPYWLSERGGACIYSILRGLLRECDKHEWRVELVHSSGDEKDNEPAHPEFIDKIEKTEAKGVVWLQPVPTHKMNIMRLIDRGYTVVVTGRHFTDLPAKFVFFDLDDMARKVVDYLTSRNVKNPVMLTGPIDGLYSDPYSCDVVAALTRRLDEAGVSMPYERICQAAFAPAQTSIVNSFFEQCCNVDGLICLHEYFFADLEKMDQSGFFDGPEKLPLIDVSGIFNHYDHKLNNIQAIPLIWPLEDMGTAIALEFQKDWQREAPDSQVNLCIEIRPD